MGSYVPSTQAQREQMLRGRGAGKHHGSVPGCAGADAPAEAPEHPRRHERAGGKPAVSAMAAENRTYATVLRGAGAYDHYIPPSSNISLPRRSPTAYTPYQRK